MTNFKSYTDLNNFMDKVIQQVIDNVSKTLLEDFQDHLDNTVYGAEKSPKYKRYYKDGGFYSGWDIERVGNYVRRLIFDGDKLVSPKNDYINQHKAHAGQDIGGDIRNILQSVLDDAVLNERESMDGGARYLRGGSEGYWKSYLIDIDKKIFKWLDNEFAKFGIVRR